MLELSVAPRPVLLVPRRRRLDLEMVGHAVGVLTDDGRPGVVLHRRLEIEIVAGDVPDAVTRPGEGNDVAVFGCVNQDP